MSSSRSSILNLELDSQFSPPSATRLYGKGQFINPTYKSTYKSAWTSYKSTYKAIFISQLITRLWRVISRHRRVISRLISRHRRVISLLIGHHRRVISRLNTRHRRVISWLISRLRRLRLTSRLGRVISRLISCFFSFWNFFSECPIGGSVQKRREKRK